MVLDYYSTNYIGWPIPAYFSLYVRVLLSIWFSP